MKKDWVDFKRIREQVGIVDILNHYGLIDEAPAVKEQFKIHCPFHDDSKPSCNIHTEMQAFRCFGCGVHGGILMLVRLKEGIESGNDLEDDREAGRLIQEWFGIEAKRTRPKPREKSSKRPKNASKDEKDETDQGERIRKEEDEHGAAVNGRALDTPGAGESSEDEDESVNQPIGDEASWFPQRDPEHEYLTIERGLTPETIAHFQIGYHGGRGMMSGRIVIPIHNEHGELVAFAGRWPGDPPAGEADRLAQRDAQGGGEPVAKYKLPPKFKASHVVYNLHRVSQNERVIILTEGFFDVIALYQAARVPAIALMGTNLSAHQEALITERFSAATRIVLAFDPDPAGQKCASDCLTRLGRSFWVKSVPYPELLAEFKERSRE